MPPSTRKLMKRPCSSKLLRGVLAFIVGLALVQSPLHAQRVRATGFSDVNFGVLANLQSDYRQSQSICVFSNGATRNYSVSAWGSGPGGSFELSNAQTSLTYDVEWSGNSGQVSGAGLTPNVPLTGQSSAASHQLCSTGPATSASFTVILRAVELGVAREGFYSGTLSFLISAE